MDIGECLKTEWLFLVLNRKFGKNSRDATMWRLYEMINESGLQSTEINLCKEEGGDAPAGYRTRIIAHGSQMAP